MTIQNIFIFQSILLSGLIAGLLFSYSCSVNPGLRFLSDNEYIKAMQSINNAIQNLYFFIPFLGLLLVLPISTFLNYKNQIDLSFYLVLLATIIYVFGVFGITMFGNVPLNEHLAKFSITTATSYEISEMRQSFEKPWNSYHTLRTAASIISFSLTIFSLIKSKP